MLRTDQGLLIRSLTQADTGLYHCQAIEHGFIQPLLRLNLQVIPTHKLGDILPGLPGLEGGLGHSAKHRVWYRDFLSLLDHPELNSVEEFCDRVWKKERKQKKAKTPNGNNQGKPNSAGVLNSPVRPKASASAAQKQQAGPPHSKPWLQAGAPTVVGQTRSQNTQKDQPNSSPIGSQAAKGNQKNQNGQKGQGGLAGSQVTGGSRGSSQHAAKWRRLQENKKGRNRRTHELQRPPRSVWEPTPRLTHTSTKTCIHTNELQWPPHDSHSSSSLFLAKICELHPWNDKKKKLLLKKTHKGTKPVKKTEKDWKPGIRTVNVRMWLFAWNTTSCT